MRRLVAFPLAMLGAAVTITLTGCAPTVTLDPAAEATDPACAAVIVALRNSDPLAELPARETNAQGTAAWGSPVGVILRCGVPEPAPTATLPCFTVDGIDWLRDDSDDPRFVFTTYGRSPAVEVIIDDTLASGLAALTEVAPAVGQLPSTGACVSPQDTLAG